MIIVDLPKDIEYSSLIREHIDEIIVLGTLLDYKMVASKNKIFDFYRWTLFISGNGGMFFLDVVFNDVEFMNVCLRRSNITQCLIKKDVLDKFFNMIKREL